MKRCPDCGFHSKEELKTCPLCGVRMREDSNWKQPRYTGHVHREKGEECLLPNTGKEQAKQERYRKVMEQQILRGRKQSSRSAGTHRQQSAGKQFAGIFAALALFALMKACGL